MTPVDRALEHAVAATTATEQLAALIEAWRAYESPELGELVEAAGRRAITERPALTDRGTLAERQAHWLAVARRGDVVELPWVLARVMTGRREDTLVRLRAIAKVPADPRISTVLVELYAKPELRSHRAVWTLIFSILRRARDWRIAPRVAELSAQLRPVTTFDRLISNHLERLARVIAEREPLPAPHPAAAPVAQLAARLLGDATAREATSRAKTTDDFLREIWSAPDDDGPREVFADWLIERGDPRGELITLQLARARGTTNVAALRREKALLAKHARTWLGVLDPVVSRTRCVFERGFPARCEVVWRRLGAQRELWAHPAWATVREYTLPAEGERDCDAWVEHMIALGAKRA